MGKVYETIDSKLAGWIRQQHMFFVATAPLDAAGCVNCSPKGGDTFRILNDTEVAYQDLTGSGVETIAHLQENGRIVIMFCAFEGKPKIVRLHGKGTVLTEKDEQFQQLVSQFPAHIGTRAIIHIRVKRISDSCGYSVPLYEFKDQRDVLDEWSAKKGEMTLKKYRKQKNSFSVDGLAGLNDDSSS
ncbi:MAG: pyridoxamine 5'-phosphate oxidase family protein [Cyanobacteria bacterium P01_F01_bin.42]